MTGMSYILFNGSDKEVNDKGEWLANDIVVDENFTSLRWYLRFYLTSSANVSNAPNAIT